MPIKAICLLFRTRFQMPMATSWWHMPITWPTRKLWWKMWLNFTSSTSSELPCLQSSGVSSTCSPCTPWYWTQQSGWPPLNFAQRTRPGAHPGFKLSNRRKKKTMSRLSPRTAKRSFFPQISRIGDDRAVKISDHKTTTETAKINNNGGTTTRQQLQPQQNDVHFLQKTRSPSRRMQKEDQFQPAMSGPQ